MNNLRQINMGIRMYSDDSSDATPSPGVSAVSTNRVPLYAGYKELTKNYVGLRGIFGARQIVRLPGGPFFPQFCSRQ